MPTLLAITGKKIPEYIDGVNLTPALVGGEQNVRKWLHFEHAPCYSKAQAYQALTDGHFKYIWRPTDGRELLFDLDRDLAEERDLSKEDSHAATLKLWRGRLLARLADRPEGFIKNGKLISGRPYPALNKGTLGVE